MMVPNGRSKKLPKHVLKLPLTSSQSQLEPSGVYLAPAIFQKGDLVVLNMFGKIMCVDTNPAVVGVVMSYPRNCHLRAYPEEHMYWVYDVFVGSELIIGVPQDFMRGLNENETMQNCK
jgi:hypothetical protein